MPDGADPRHVTKLANAVFPAFGPYPAYRVIETAELVPELLQRLTLAIQAEDLTGLDLAAVRELVKALSLAAARLTPLFERLVERLEQDIAPAINAGGDFDTSRSAMVAALALHDAGPFADIVVRALAEALHHLDGKPDKPNTGQDGDETP